MPWTPEETSVWKMDGLLPSHSIRFHNPQLRGKTFVNSRALALAIERTATQRAAAPNAATE